MEIIGVTRSAEEVKRKQEKRKVLQSFPAASLYRGSSVHPVRKCVCVCVFHAKDCKAILRLRT